MERKWSQSPQLTRPRKGFVARGPATLRRSLTLCRLSLRAMGLAAWMHTVMMLDACDGRSGAGARLLPGAVRAVRGLAGRQRELAGQWLGESIPAPYAQLPDPRTRAEAGKALRAELSDRKGQHWRDWHWVAVDPLIGGTLALLPPALVGTGIWGLVTAVLGSPLGGQWEGLWYLYAPVDGWLTSALAALFGLLMFPLALWTAPRTVGLHARFVRFMLAPKDRDSAALSERIDHLTTTRSDAVDTQMAEIRRIERDLHDGAQVRLVAMGMTLDAAERQLATNPEAVRDLLVEARHSSTKALEELRDLVRGIHPPILADRGLSDAVRSLAMLSPLTAEVSIDLDSRPEPPVESAVYFAVAEILANAAKHSDAQRVWIDMRHDDGMLRVTISDDGRGGADLAGGTGLRGIERRLATFDGILAVSSPLNGPTMVTMELPCALFSQKTTSF